MYKANNNKIHKGIISSKVNKTVKNLSKTKKLKNNKSKYKSYKKTYFANF